MTPLHSVAAEFAQTRVMRARAQPICRAYSASTTTGNSKVLYESAPPRLVLNAAKLLALKSIACLGYGTHVLARAAVHPEAAYIAPRVSAGAMHDMLSLTAQLGGGFLALGILAGYVAVAIPSRTVLRMDLDPAPKKGQSDVHAIAQLSPEDTAALCGQNPNDIVHITRPGYMWGTRSATYARRDLCGASATRIVQSFRIRSARTGNPSMQQYLFPVEPGWRSDDLPYLRTLVYGEFFRPYERSPPVDAPAIAIAGFGPYRPAQFADPHHVAFQLFPKGEVSAMPGTPFRIAEGTVWADFVAPSVARLADLRAQERRVKVEGAKIQDVLGLAKVAAPTTLMLDGSTLSPQAASLHSEAGEQAQGQLPASKGGQRTSQ